MEKPLTRIGKKECDSTRHTNCSGLRGDLDAIPFNERPCDIADWVEEEE